MPGIRPALAALAAVACGLVLLACGSDEDGTIPAESGEQLLERLNRVEDAVEAGDCDAAAQAALEVAQAVNELPTEVSGELREALVEASANLTELTREQCEEPHTGPTGETDTAPPPTEDPEPPAEVPTDEEESEPEEDEGGGDDGRGNPPPGPEGNPGGGGDGGDDDSGGGVGSDG